MDTDADTNNHAFSVQKAYEDGLAKGREESWQAIRQLCKTPKKELKEMGFDLEGIAGEANHWIYVISILSDYTAEETISMMKGITKTDEMQNNINKNYKY